MVNNEIQLIVKKEEAYFIGDTVLSMANIDKDHIIAIVSSNPNLQVINRKTRLLDFEIELLSDYTHFRSIMHLKHPFYLVRDTQKLVIVNVNTKLKEIIDDECRHTWLET